MFFKNTFNKLGYKKIKIKRDVFIIKKLTPVDFLDKEGVPFTLFSVQKPSTIYGQVMGQIKTDSEIEKEETEMLKVIRQVVSLGVVRFPKDTDTEDFLQPDTLEIGIALYDRIIKNSMSLFLRAFSIDSKQLIYFDFMAKRYSQTPIQCLVSNEKYSAVDAFIFNSLCITEGIKLENSQTKKDNAASKKTKGFRK